MLTFLCIWTNLSSTSFNALVENSIATPVFAMCGTPTCPHCKGIPEKLKVFAERIGAHLPVVCTYIDCTKSHACRKIGVRGVPSFALIRGPHPRFWKRTHDRCPLKWKVYLEEELGKQARNLEAQSDHQLMRTGTTSGLSSFYFTYSMNRPQDLEEFQAVVKNYSFYGGMFYYKGINASIDPVLKVHIGENTERSFKQAPIEKIVNRYKFSIYSSYDDHDIKQSALLGPLALYLSPEKPSHDTFKAIESLASQHTDYVFGWTQPTDKIYKILGLNESSLSSLALINNDKKCVASTTLEGHDALHAVLKGEGCLNSKHVKKVLTVPSKEPKHGLLWLLIGGIVASAGYFVYVLFWDKESKLE